MVDFRNCKKASEKLNSLLVRVNDIEDEADALFLNIIRELYVKECDNPMRVSVWTRLFEQWKIALTSVKRLPTR